MKTILALKIAVQCLIFSYWLLGTAHKIDRFYLFQNNVFKLVFG